MEPTIPGTIMRPIHWRSLSLPSRTESPYSPVLSLAVLLILGLAAAFWP